MPQTRNEGIWELIEDLLQRAGNVGATKDGLVNQLGSVLECNPKMAISTSLARAIEREEVAQYGNNFYLTAYAPSQNGSASQAIRQAANVAPYQQKRAGYKLEIHINPQVYNECIGLALRFEGNPTYMPLPFFGAVRIFVGFETPEWTPQQQAYNRVTDIAVRFRNKRGEFEDENIQVTGNQVVVIAPL